MKDGEMHATAGLGSLAVLGLLGVPTVVIASREPAPPPEVFDVMEASLAYKKPDSKQKQPQKPKNEPTPVVEPQGVSRDETKPPPPEEKDKPKPSTNEDPLAKFRRKQDDDLEAGKPVEDIGAFDGSEFGIGDVTKGDPYFQKLVVDLAWSSPELAKAGATAPIGCIQLTKEGKIPRTTFKEKGDDDIATLAESALRDLQKLRNDKPEEVPTHLLKALTTRWVCFKFTVKSS